MKHSKDLRWCEKREYYSIPLSLKRLYSIWNLDKESKNYNVPFGISLNDPIDVRHLERSIQILISRHDSLRSSFHIADDEVVLKVHDQVAFQVETVDLLAENISPDALRAQISRFIEPFNLSQAPLLRVKLIRLGIQQYFVLCDLHHIITDNNSIAIFKKELFALFSNQSLPPIAFQYKDYITWLNRPSVSDEYLRQKKYWLNQFQGEIPSLNLPLDKWSDKEVNTRVDEVHFQFGQTLTQALRKFAYENGATPFMVFFAWVSIWLGKICGQEDIVIGIPVDGRNQASLRNVFGMFVNTVAIRSQPFRDKSFLVFLNEVKQNIINALMYQHFPFEELLIEKAAKRDHTKNLLFSVLLNMITKSRYPGAAGDHGEPENVEHMTSGVKCDLDLKIIDDGNDLLFSIVYSPDLFNRETILRTMTGFLNISQSVLADPQLKIQDIRLLSRDQEEKLLAQYYQHFSKGSSPNWTIQSLLNSVFTRFPDYIAMADGEIHLSYRELENRIIRFASQIRELNLGGGNLIGVLIENRMEFIIWILAVLKTRNIFVPLYSELPAERLAKMIQSANIQVICVDEKTIGIFREEKDFWDSKLWLQKNDTLYQSSFCDNQIKDIPDPEDPIYLYFTSGSTGIPKGVLGQNKGLCHFITWEIKTFGVDNRFSIAQFTNPGFDVFLRDLFVPLCSGGTIIIPRDKEIILDRVRMIEWMNLQQINLIHLVPGLFRGLSEGGCNQFDFKSLKFILLAGEKVKPQDLGKWFNIFSDRIQLVNLYGPTETTLAKLFHWIEKKDQEQLRVPIGSPIDNTAALILDSSLNCCDYGIQGEIFIHTPYKSLGYLNDPVLTDSRFVNHPYGTKYPPGQIYQTGDLGKYYDNGTFDILGRMDRQVKIRGMRIQLEEIEKVIFENKRVLDVVVVEKSDHQNQNFLCAYVLSQINQLELQLREELKKKLPDYMIPTFIVLMEKFPLNTNGKVNLKLLPQPEFSILNHFVAPQTRIEKRMAAIWAKILGISESKVGLTTGFFELGGHSLNATLLVSEIEKNLGLSLTITDIFRHQTITQLLSQYKAQLKSNELNTIRAIEKKHYYPVSSAQKRLYSIQQMDLSSTVYNMPKEIDLGNQVDILKLKRVFFQILAGFENLRTSFEFIGDQLVQRIHDSVDFDIEYYQAGGVTSLNGILEDFIRPFDLSVAPLLRVALLETQGAWKLFLDMHHIIADGTSLELLRDAINRFYHDQPILPLRLQYKDYSEWNNYLQGTEMMKIEENFWKNLFKDGIPLLNLPLDKPRPDFFNSKGKKIYFLIDSQRMNEISKIAQPINSTMFMNILAIISILLSKYSGQDDLLIGAAVSGRNHSDIQNIIGNLANILCIRCRPGGDKTFIQYLKEVRDHCLLAYENQDVQFERLVEILNVKRDFSRNPVIDISIGFQNYISKNQGDESFSLDEWQNMGNYFLKEEDLSIRVKHDLTFFILESNQGLLCAVEYYSEIFLKSTILDLIKHLIGLVDQIILFDQIRLQDIHLSSALKEAQFSQSEFEFGSI